MPPVTVVVPVYWLAAVSRSVPAPILAKPPTFVAGITPASWAFRPLVSIVTAAVLLANRVV